MLSNALYVLRFKGWLVNRCVNPLSACAAQTLGVVHLLQVGLQSCSLAEQNIYSARLNLLV